MSKMKIELPQAELEDQVSQLMEALHVPGVAVGILHGETELMAGFGVTSIEHPLEVTPRTLFQIGSITKTFTATALMRMVESKALDLDVPLQNYLPEFALANEKWAKLVTPRHLLTHTGGWDGDYLMSNPIGGRGDDALQRVVGAMPLVPLLTRPGTLYHYNNTGFSVAGRLLEVLSGQTYEQAVAELVLEPLGLKHSFLLPEKFLTHRFAIPHTHTSLTEIKVAQWWQDRQLSAAGAIIADVHDLLRYARFHIGGGRTASGKSLLRADTIAAMQSPEVEIGDMAEAVGLSWMLDRVESAWRVSHLGSSNGQEAMLQMVPERDFVLVILTNADTGLLLNQQLADWLIERLLGIDQPDPALIELSPSALQEYVGIYEGGIYSIDVSLGQTGLDVKALIKNLPKEYDSPAHLPDSTIDFYERDRAIAVEGTLKGFRSSFIRNNDGAIEWLRFTGRIHRFQRK